MNKTVLIASLALAVFPSAPMAQSFPDKPVRMIVSYAAGNVTDILARLLGQKLTEKWGQQVVIDNRPGAGGNLGAELAAKAPSDGYTMLVTAVAAMAVNPHIYSNVRYNPFKDFTPIALVAFAPQVLVVHPGIPAKNLNELLQHAKANPGALNWGSPGSGTISHLNMAYLKLNHGLAVEHVPYKGASAIMTDLIAGRVQMTSDGWPVVLSHIRAGSVRPVAVTSLKRSGILPDLPTVAETFPGYEAGAWTGIMAPAGVSQEIVRKVNADILDAIKTKELAEIFARNGLDPLGGTPQDFAARLRTDYDRYGKLVKQIGVRVD